jgi:hypothetical protein
LAADHLPFVNGGHATSSTAAQQHGLSIEADSTASMLRAASQALRRRVTRPRPFLAALAAFCLSQAALMHMHNRFLALSGGQPVLDLRPEGYSAADVHTLLDGCSAEARRAYVVLAAIDLLPYMWTYAWLLCAALSVAARAAPVEALKCVNLLPWAAAAVDAAETAQILAMLLARDARVTATLAPYVAAASRTKWTLLYGTACVLLGSGTYTLAVAAGIAGKRPAAAGDGDAAAAAAAAPSRGRGAGGRSSGRQRRQR